MDRTLVGIVLFSCAFVCQCVAQRSTTGQDVNPSRRCQTCPPTWISTLDLFKEMLMPMITKVCSIAKLEKFIGTCDTPNTICSTSSTHNANFCCCPARMLSSVANCLKGQPNICVPDTFKPWQTKITTAMMSGMFG